MYRRESIALQGRATAHRTLCAVRCVALGVALAGCLAPIGCSRTQDEPDAAFPAIPRPDGQATDAESSRDRTPPTSAADAPGVGEPPPDATETADLSLKLKPGDRFPLMKTVRQHITQYLPQGQATGWSELQLLMAITVAEQVDTQRRFEVRYQRVRYAHEIGGERVEYDSTRPPAVIPEAAQVYHGMVDNGFSFWLGPNHRVLRVDGFDEFLRRSVAHVPESRRAAVLTSFERISSEETIANFIDESIGLLPDPQTAGKPLMVGTQWSPPGRQIVRPVPMYIRTSCRLTEVSPRFAHVVISGTISPGTAYGPSTQQASGLQLFIRGGEVAGECTIDLQTGLPIRSQIDRLLEMWVQLQDGTHIRQQKTTSTIIQSFPAQSEQPAAAARHDAEHTPANAVVNGGEGPRGRSRLQAEVAAESNPAVTLREAPGTSRGGDAAAVRSSGRPDAAEAQSPSAPQPVRRVPRLVPPQTLQ